ncbi:MAG TPA: alpha/beta fold hydrolase, partial [Vicinamibacterales bacterium]|nr:alpha/beta fold hydrolase [Vicinamibacterales bacterium]
HVDSVFRLASVQKSMTAVAVLQLAEQGKLDLDADIQTYVPYYPRKPHRITARQLLSHLGGVPHYVHRDVEQHIKTHKTTREAVEIFANFDLIAEPGTRYSYSSYGYNLLGAAIEGASGMPYGEYMTRYVWRPAGMPDTRMDDPEELIPNRVRGYRRVDGQLKNSEFIDVSSRFAAGGTRGTVPDLLRFLRAILNHTLLSAKTTELMLTPARTRSGEEIPYALGWQIPPIENRGRIVFNDGGQQETRTNFFLDPASDFGMALAMNLEADIYFPVMARLWELVQGRPLVNKPRAAAAVGPPPALTIEPHTYEASNGTKVEAELGEFRVPENRAKRDSRTITLRFVRFRSTAAKPGHPIVYLAGGPGGSGIESARGSRFPLFMALREFGDVIAFDQRGTNQSEPDMRCNEKYEIAAGEPLDRAKAGVVWAEAARRCVERLRASGIDVGAYNTRESAADLEDFRRALGAQKLILWGISYGTHLSIATMRYHPDTVDRALLAGIEGPDDTYKLPSDQQTLMEDIARLAARDGKHPDLVGSIAKLLRELETNPKRLTLTHPDTQQKIEFVFGKLDLQRVLANMLTGPDSFAGMPEFIARLERGEWVALGTAAAPQRFGSHWSAMSLAMDCASGMSAARRQRIAA